MAVEHETGLENPLLGDAFAEGESEFPGLGTLGLADVQAAYPELDFLTIPPSEWTPEQRSAYNFALSYLETGDWYARSFDRNSGFDPTRDYSEEFGLLGIDQPEWGPEAVINRYEAENGEGSFSDLSWGEQRDIMRDSNVGWSRTDHHEYNDTLGGYDREGFTGYDEDATYSYAYGLEADGNSGYQSLRPWDVEAQEMTVGELREIYASDGNLQATFGSEEDFLNYVAEMNYAGFGDIYGENQSSAAGQDYYQNPIATDIFERYATGSGDLQVSYDPVHGYVATNAMGDTFKWTGSQWMPEQIAYRPSTLGSYVKMAVSAGLGLATGNAAGILGAAGGLGGTVSGALSGALGSAVGQVVAGGKIDAGSLLQAAILGAIGGFADSLQNMDSAIADGGILGTADDIVNATSELLGVGYDEALAILEGVATGAVSGGDLESIVAGAAGSWSSAKMKDFLQGFYGDTIQVDDWFKDGASNIPVEALDPFIDQIVGGIIDGSIDDPGAWLKTVWDYFQAGGDVDFMLPDGIDLTGLFSLGSFDFSVCRTPDDGSEKPWYCNLPDTGDLPNPCEDWEILEGVCNAKIVCLNSGGEWDSSISDCVGSYLPDGEILCLNSGGEWDSSIGECIKSWLPDGSLELGEPCEDDEGNPGWLSPTGLCDVEIPELPEIGTPCSVDGEQGVWALTELDEFVCEVDIRIETPYDCSERGEGWTWDNLVGDCVPPLDAPCNAGSWDEVLKACLCGDGSPENPDGSCPDITVEPPCNAGEWDEVLKACICGDGSPENPDGSCPDITVKPPCNAGEWNEALKACICGDGSPENPDGSCPDITIKPPCNAGSWSETLKACICGDGSPENPDGSCPDITIEGPDWNVGDPCTDEEGNLGFLNELGVCDIQLPDLPLSSGAPVGPYTPTWGELFAYTPFTPATGKQIADVDLGLLSEARKILG